VRRLAGSDSTPIALRIVRASLPNAFALPERAVVADDG
jgi:hypothetical protein